jgi:prevent-host-death family protein
MAKQTKTPMIKTLAAQTARTQFGQVFDLVREGKARFVVERNGEPIGAIVSIEDLYELLGKVLPKSEALAALQTHSRRRGLDLLTLDDVNKEIGEVREAAGRKRKSA